MTNDIIDLAGEAGAIAYSEGRLGTEKFRIHHISFTPDTLLKFAELVQARTWQPIETVPMDGTKIIVAGVYEMDEDRYRLREGDEIMRYDISQADEDALGYRGFNHRNGPNFAQFWAPLPPFSAENIHHLLLLRADQIYCKKTEYTDQYVRFSKLSPEKQAPWISMATEGLSKIIGLILPAGQKGVNENGKN